MISKSALFISCVATVTALKCNDNNDALLQVKYNITQDEWKRTRHSGSGALIYPFLELPGSWKYYFNFKDLVDFEVCLPRNNCTEVVLSGLPIYAYELSFDGKPTDIEVELPFGDKNSVTSTEVGTCIKPTCKDTEALIEFQNWVDRFSISSPYLIEDQDGNIIIDDAQRMNSSMTRNRSCVPRDNSCYMFLIGSHHQLDADSPSPSYTLFYDGKLVRKSVSWLFDSVQFGDACQPACNQDNESLVELFLYDYGDLYLHPDDPHGAKYEYEWDLKLVTDGASDQSTSGVVQIGPDKSPLYHKTMCVPKDSCSSFYISAPQNARRLTYSLAMDGTTYRKTQWYPGLSSGNNFLDQTIYMGSCTVGDLCDKQSQDLFDLELHTPVEYKQRNGSSAAMIQAWGIDWRFGYSDVDKRYPHFDPVLSSWQYNDIGYDLDSSYRTIECVPKGDCDFAFNITADSPVETYAVKKNGVQLDDRQKLPYGFFTDRMLFMTPFGQNCFQTNPVPPELLKPKPEQERRLSAGAIAGFVIACLVVLNVLMGDLVCLNRREERQNQRDEEDPLGENLLCKKVVTI